MAVCMAVGVGATLAVKEPRRADAVLDAKTHVSPLWTPSGLFDAVVGPFLVFFRTFGWTALLLLAMISFYRLPEFAMGPMAAPFYHDLHLSKDLVGAVRGSFGLIGSLLGIAIGGLIAARLGGLRALVVGGVLQGVAIAGFAILAWFPPTPGLFAAVMFSDNFGVSVAGVALVTYMSSLTTLGYTATQYALLTSAYTWIGKILKGFSGEAVDALEHAGHSHMEAFAIFFLGCGLIGLPAVLFCLWLGLIQRRKGQAVGVPPTAASALTS
jgi:PAT family beta-lactamase induction signal transducer AmpG